MTAACRQGHFDLALTGALLPLRFAVGRPARRIKRPRSAPACSIAIRISDWISFSRTISPDTACETLITVARSRCSTGAPIVLVGPATGFSSLRCGYNSSSCRTFPVGSPTQVAVPGVPQIRVRDLLETTCRVEARREFVGERLIVDKAVCVRRADGLFVEVHGIEVAAFDACDLRTHQCRAIFEILRAILRPYFELSVVSGQSLEMLLSLVGRCGIAGRRVGKSAIEVKLRRFE